MGAFSQDHYKMLFVVLAIIGIYILPTLIVSITGKERKLKVILINLLLGWTVIGWLISLIMSLKKE
jgi:hypothetical protein